MVAMMKILQITNVFRSDGGIEIAVGNVVKSLDPSKFESWWASLYPYGKFRGPLPIPEDHIICFDFSTGFSSALEAIKQASVFIRRNRFDLVHAHQFEAGLIFRIAAWITGVPVTVVTYHSTHYPRQRAGHYLIERVLASRTTQLIAVSKAVQAAVSDQLRLPRTRFTIVPNFVRFKEIPRLSFSDRQIKRRHLDLDAGQFVVISIGRLEPQKGFSILLKAMRRVIAKLPNVTLFIIGGGSLQAQLRQLVIELKLDDVVRFLGIRKDIFELLQISDVLVMPSLYEGMPIALLEAGACGLPAVASAVEGNTEIVCDGINGFLVPPYDSEALSRRIVDVLTQPDLRERMGGQARKIVGEKFNGDLVGRQLGDLYERLVNRRLSQSVAA
jgi:glycosyltransferase involved in cell wall biosynthesis